jgi:galactose mutarotase-like enzyme
MSTATILQITDATGALATVAPELGGWLLRYARPTAKHGLVDALHFEQAVVDRYPKDMWAGNPLLFPMVSFNHLPGREHHYIWQGREFALSQHGFARRSKWSVVDQGESALTMELSDNDATRAAYPFAFRHRVSYRLRDGRLHFEQVIENCGDAPMPFSTGIHPYFRVPFTTAGRRGDCFVEIPECERLLPDAHHLSFSAVPQPSQNWSVAHDVAGTLFLGGFKKRDLALVDPRSELEVILNWDDAPQHRWCALWSRSTDAPFYCLEPWTALPNSFTRAQPGEVVVLAPDATFRAALWMELREA